MHDQNVSIQHYVMLKNTAHSIFGVYFKEIKENTFSVQSSNNIVQINKFVDTHRCYGQDKEVICTHAGVKKRAQDPKKGGLEKFPGICHFLISSGLFTYVESCMTVGMVIQ